MSDPSAFLTFKRHLRGFNGGYGPDSSSMIYHCVPPVVSQTSKMLFPLYVAFAYKGFFIGCGKFLEVNRQGTSRIFFQNSDRVAATLHAVARVELHKNFFAGVAEKNVPGRLAVNRQKISLVGVIADVDAFASCLVR